MITKKFKVNYYYEVEKTEVITVHIHENETEQYAFECALSDILPTDATGLVVVSKTECQT